MGSNPPQKASLDMGNLGFNDLREQKRQGKNWSLGWRILMADDDVMLAEKRGWTNSQPPLEGFLRAEEGEHQVFE